MDLFDYPPELNAKAWIEYLEYRKEYKMRKLKPISEEKLIKWLIEQGDHKIQSGIIDQTMRNGWTGLFELKESKSNKVDWEEEAEKRGIQPNPGESQYDFNKRVKRELQH